MNVSEYPKTVDWMSRACDVTPGGVHVGDRRKAGPTLVFAKAIGARLTTVDGQQLVDYWGAGGAAILGHASNPVVRAVQEQAERGTFFGTGTSPGEVMLAETLLKHAPATGNQVLFCASEDDAARRAVQLARACTGRDVVLTFSGPLAETLTDLSAELSAATAGTLVCAYNDLDNVAEALAHAQGQVAAIVVNPIVHVPVTIEPEDGFLKGLRMLADEHGALLIFDETDSGRHHLGGFQAIAEVLPDLTTGGKSFSSGFPLAYVRGSAELMARFATAPNGTVPWGGHYNGHAVAVAAALATCDALADGQVHSYIADLGAMMRGGLNSIVEDAGAEELFTVLGYGSLFTLWPGGEPRTYADVLRAGHGLGLRYRRRLVEMGVYERPAMGEWSSAIGSAHSEEDVALTLNIASDALRSTLRSRA